MRKNGAPERLGKERTAELPRADLRIPFLAGRPDRDTSIDADDLVNLTIAFYTCKSLEEFFANT